MTRGGKRRRTPITAAAHARKGSSAKPEASRTIIRKYHVLLKRKAQLEKVAGTVKATTELQEVESEMDSIGIEAYQRMSHIGQGNDRGGGSEKVFIQYLRDAGVQKLHQTPLARLQLLEVGALRPDNYASCSKWIEVTPIDLHARVPGIIEQDFLTMDDVENVQRWHAISLSLVLNFVPDAHDRGRMLYKCREFLKPGGHLFVALPLPCVQNSRYLTIDSFKTLANAIGLRCDQAKWVDGRRMVYFIFVRDDTLQHQDTTPFAKKRILIDGSKRNNFCILL